MALSQEEIKLVKTLKASGKTDREIFRIIGRRRSGRADRPYDVPESPDSLEQLRKTPTVNEREAEARGGTDVRGRDVFGNIIPSAKRFLGDIGHAIAHPIQTVRGVSRVFGGGLTKASRAGILPGQQLLEDRPETEIELEAEAVGQFFKDRYGSVEAAKQTFINDPVGFLADFSGAAGVARGGARGVTRATRRLRPEPARPPVTPAPVDEIAEASKVARAGEPAIKPKVPDISAKIEGLAGRQAEGLIQKELLLTPGQRQTFLTKFKQTPEQYLLENRIIGSADEIAEALDQRWKASKLEVDDALAQVTATFGDESKAVGSAKKILEGLESELRHPGLEAELARVKELIAKDALTLNELNEIKRMGDASLFKFKKSGLPADAEKAKGLANLRRDVKTFIETEARKAGVADIGDLNLRTSSAITLRENILLRDVARSSKSIFGLKDLMIGFGSLGTGFPLIGGAYFVTRTLMQNAKFHSAFVEALRKLSTGEIKIIRDAVTKPKPPSATRRVVDKVMNDIIKKNPLFEADILKVGGQIGEQQQTDQDQEAP